MRSSHGCAAGGRICTITGVASRTRACARSSNIRFSTAASISRDRAAATKASNDVLTGVQSSDCIGSLIKRRRIGHRRTTGARVARSDYHLDTSSSLSFNSGLQLVADDATLRDRATPGVDGNIRRFSRIAFARCAIQWVRREEKFHALHIRRRCAVALVHVTASNPLCAGRHADLVGATIVADRCASGVASVEKVIARKRRVRAANTAAGMDAVVPVKVVIGVDSVPATVVRFERIVRPANTGVGARNDDGFSAEPKRPYIRRVRVSNARLDRRRSPGATGLQRGFLNQTGLRKVILNMRIACNARHVGTGRQCFRELAVSFH